MQFVKDGPSIPDALLQSHEDGNVVFFCGAGISYPAELPGFKGLVDQIYEVIGETKNELETNSYEKEQFDSTLDLLERRVSDGRKAVRKALWKSLKPKLRKRNALRTHESLLKLACDGKGTTRLVTTNFDRIFEAVIKRKKLNTNSFVAPFLPVPKKSRWDGLVYLHGLSPEREDSSSLNRLVFTSGDFGLAYLIERWASRFVSDLFRNYVICFIGYSINDPVLRYMMDALAADRMLGEEVPDAYAFGDYAPENAFDVENEWKAKGVTPILYSVEPNSDDHSKLHDTLEIWANTYSEGALGKESIIAKYATSPPTMSTKEDDYVGRVIWALSEPNGSPAKHFADLTPCPPIDWLEKISERKFSIKDLPRFGVFESKGHPVDLAFSLIERPTSSSSNEWGSIRSFSYRGHNPDRIMFQISRWFLRHLNDPTLAYWLTSYNGRLSERFKDLLERKLSELNALGEDKVAELKVISPNAIPDDSMLTLWKMLLANRVASSMNRMNSTNIYHWLERTKINGFTSISQLELRGFLAPKISIRKPFSSSVKRYDWELVLTEKISNHEIKKIIGTTNIGRLFDDFQMLLTDALNLAQEMGGAERLSDRSYWDLPSISEHSQNRGFHDWVKLIELLRDSWLQIFSEDASLAKLKAISWFNKPFPTFKRLALFAARYDQVIEPHVWCDWLCKENGWWLWSSETQRETMRLLVLQGKNVDKENLLMLENTILKGLPRKMFREDLKDDYFQELNNHVIWLYLAKLQSGGVTIGDEANLRYLELVNKYPEWKVDSKYEKDEFSHWMSGSGDSDYEDSRTYELAPTEPSELMKWLMKSELGRTFDHDDNWRELCREDMPLALDSLNALLNQNEFPVARWKSALWVWSEGSLIAESWDLAAPVITSFSDKHVLDCIHPIAQLLQAVSKDTAMHKDMFISLVKRIFAVYVQHEDTEDERGVTITAAINNPVGMATKALIDYWFTTQPKDNDRLGGEFYRVYNKICNEPSSKFDHGKLILASQAIALFRVDPEWMNSQLIPMFDWKANEKLANIVWQGFLWAPRIHRPLIEIIKKPLVDTASRLSTLEDEGRQYIQLFIYIALEQNSILSDLEVRSVLTCLSADSLADAARVLNQALSASERKEEFWAKRILPLWKNSWPKSESYLTESIVESFVELCINAGNYFAHAIAEMEASIRTIKHSDYTVSQMLKSKVFTTFPNEAMNLTHMIVDRTRNPPYDLKECLDISLASSTDVVNNPKYVVLREFLRLHGQ